jgi:hypothetical protein
MTADCYRVVVSESARLAGYTAAGRRASIVPGEHVVQRLRLKVPLDGISEALRFLGADARGGDVHIPVRSEADIERVLHEEPASE